MSRRVHVFIATTAGPVRLESIELFEAADHAPGAGFAAHMVVAGLGTASFAGRYREFVETVVAPRFQRRGFIASVARDIHTGDSWRLPVLLGHEVTAREDLDLAMDDPVAGDLVIIATGEVTHRLEVLAVDGVDSKLRHARGLISMSLDAGAEVLLMIPADNRAEVPEDMLAALPKADAKTLRLLAGEHFDALLAQVDALTVAASERSAANRKVAATAATPAPRKRATALWAGGGLAAVLLGVLGWSLQVSDVPAVAPVETVAFLPPKVADDHVAADLAAEYVSLEVAMARHFNGCQDGDVIERRLQPEGQDFPDVSLQRLCRLRIVTDSPEERAAHVLALGPLRTLNAAHDESGWEVPLPTVHRHDRLLAYLIVDPSESEIEAWLEDWVAEQGEVSDPQATLAELRAAALDQAGLLQVHGQWLRGR